MSTYPTSHNLAIVPEPARHVVIAPPAHPSEKNKRAFTLVGAFQLIVGIVVAIMGGYLASQLQTSSHTSTSGIGAGILYGVTGILALSSGSGPTRCNVNGGMVLAIFSAISSGVTAAIGGFALAELGYRASSTALGIVGTLVGLCALEFILSIVHAAYCCSGSCCSTSYQTGMVLQDSNVTTYPQPPQVNVAPPAYGKTDIPYKPYSNDPDV